MKFSWEKEGICKPPCCVIKKGRGKDGWDVWAIDMLLFYLSAIRTYISRL
jgi:hypothetical protein